MCPETPTAYKLRTADTTQTLTDRAARAPEPHGEEADEGIHECTSPILEADATFFVGSKLMVADVLQPRPAMLRLVRQRLREQVSHLARRRLRHALCRQAHERLSAPRRPIPGAECCYGTGWPAWPISWRSEIAANVH